MKIKLIIETTSTKPGKWSEGFCTSKITNTANGKSFITGSVGESSVLRILRKMGLEWEELYYHNNCTGSVRFDSLPKTELGLDHIRLSKEWLKELHKIGIRNISI